MLKRTKKNCFYNLDFAAGDSCFYIGLGNTKTSTPSFEPYQCCPKPTSSPAGKQKTGKPMKKDNHPNDEPKTNGGKSESNNKKKEKRNKKDNGKASWWW